MSAHPEFNLDRKISIENNVDAEGKKWELHSSKKHPGLVWARPNPDRTDAIIPKLFYGMWTSKERLQKQIEQHLAASWNKAEAAADRARLVAFAAKAKIEEVVEPVVEVIKQTAEESLAALPDEIKDFLGDTIATEVVEEKPVAKKKVTKKKAVKKTD